MTSRSLQARLYNMSAEACAAMAVAIIVWVVVGFVIVLFYYFFSMALANAINRVMSLI